MGEKVSLTQTKVKVNSEEVLTYSIPWEITKQLQEYQTALKNDSEAKKSR